VRALASAPGKVILFGEHFVVEDQPAVAVAISLRARVRAELTRDSVIRVSSRNLKATGEYSIAPAEEKDPLYPIAYAAYLAMNKAGETRGVNIEVDSDIPPGAGMGSSAAVAVATVAATASALGLELSLDEISKLAHESEKIVHGKPSGIDNTIATFGGAIAYRKSEGFVKLNVDFSDLVLVLADTGKPRNTGELVKRVLTLKAAFPSVFEPLYYAAGRLAVEAAKLMERGDWEAVGSLMNVNHGLLSAIGVSTLELENLVYSARRAGALGAKLTGAGGGGFIVALCKKGEETTVVQELERASPRVFVSRVSERGVIVEAKN